MLRRHSRISHPQTLHFVTTTARVRGSWFVESSVCRRVLEIFEAHRAKTNVSCIGYVLMTDHFHALLAEPDNGASAGALAAVSKELETGLLPARVAAQLPIPELMRRFKQHTSRFCRPSNFPARTLWRLRYDDVLVPGSDAVYTKLNYLHQNPVKKGLSSTPEEYSWSSAGCYFTEHDDGLIRITRL